MHGVVLDGESLGPDLDLGGLCDELEHWDWYDRTGPAEVAPRIAAADIVVTNKVVLDAASLAAAERLRLICVAATGVNNIDLEAAAGAGITVCNAVGYATASVAQHTWALILTLATQLCRYRELVQAGGWTQASHFCRLDLPIQELAGGTLGIVGYGELGRAVAAAAPAFGLETVLAARPGTTAIPAGRVPLPDLLERADILSLHCPLTEHTRGLIGRAELARMKPSALLINTARGGIVDEEALVDGLRAGEIAGAGIDVLTQEPPAPDNPLLADDVPNLIVTPHCAWGARAARQRLIEQVRANIAAFRAGAPRNIVQPEVR